VRCTTFGSRRRGEPKERIRGGKKKKGDSTSRGASINERRGGGKGKSQIRKRKWLAADMFRFRGKEKKGLPAAQGKKEKGFVQLERKKKEEGGRKKEKKKREKSRGSQMTRLGMWKDLERKGGRVVHQTKHLRGGGGGGKGKIPNGSFPPRSRLRPGGGEARFFCGGGGVFGDGS